MSTATRLICRLQMLSISMSWKFDKHLLKNQFLERIQNLQYPRRIYVPMLTSKLTMAPGHRTQASCSRDRHSISQPQTRRVWQLLIISNYVCFRFNRSLQNVITSKLKWFATEKVNANGVLGKQLNKFQDYGRSSFWFISVFRFML